MYNTIPMLFVVDSIINVTACALGKQKLRRVSKVLLMPLLALCYLFFAPEPSWLVTVAVLLGWVGDIFLIFKKNPKLLAAGMLAFGLGHVFYNISIFMLRGVEPPLWAAVAVPLMFLCAVIFAFGYLKKFVPKELKLPTLCYMTLLTSLPVFALLALLSGAPGGWALLGGGLLFLVSDGTLSMETFVLEDSSRLDFVVMLTYIAAQALLVVGFCAA